MRYMAFALAMCGAVLGQTVPRPAPDKMIDTSIYRGRVVLLAFISTKCPHCQRLSGVLEQLSHEYAGKVQVAEVVAFDENPDIAAFRKKFAPTLPIVTGNSDQARDFLGIPHGLRVATPQVVVIDQAGMIRAQSERNGTPLLQTHDYLRDMLNAILGGGRR